MNKDIFKGIEPKKCSKCGAVVKVGLNNFIGWQPTGNGTFKALFNCKCKTTLASKKNVLK